MRFSVLAGLVIALFAGALAALGGPLTLESVWPLLLAAAVALVPGGRLLGRLLAFVTGLAAAWVAFALRAGVLPDIPAGRAVFAAVGVLMVVAVVAATGARAPLWAGLAGMAIYGSTYHPIFNASPTDFMTQSVATLTSVALAAGIGAAAAMLVRPSDRVEQAEASASSVGTTSTEVTA